jgi:predicted membrane GTPase involved in stress response
VREVTTPPASSDDATVVEVTGVVETAIGATVCSFGADDSRHAPVNIAEPASTMTRMVLCT